MAVSEHNGICREVTPYANSVFEQPWWLDIVAKDQWSECILNDEKTGEVIGRLPYVKRGSKIYMPHYTQTLGMWLHPSLMVSDQGNYALFRRKEAMMELIHMLPKSRNIRITLDHSVDYVLPFRWCGYRCEPTFSYRIMDLSDLEKVKSNISKSVFKSVKPAINSVSIEMDSNDISGFLKLVAMTYGRQKRKNPIDDRFSAETIERAMESGHGKLILARDAEGVLHAGAFFLYDEKTCYYLMGGQNPDYKSDGAQCLVLVRGIEWASTVSKEFDFEGSMVEGIENFFRKFGGSRVINYEVKKLSIIEEIKDIMKPRVKRLIGYKI